MNRKKMAEWLRGLAGQNQSVKLSANGVRELSRYIHGLEEKNQMANGHYARALRAEAALAAIEDRLAEPQRGTV